ncbi:hypothetical protein [uncultured Tyzzerella sp.]|uniref:hypothetical protein n=1 Tax=uncultured Tyzzerella sp. TaxID=2321398 RepID=UPI002941D082|nr:hypothetical protein [uncultured Tyzzerella sp.]
MKYILINPVTDQMYEKDILNNFLKINGYTRVFTNNNWANVVMEKYDSTIKNTKNTTVIDMRCPLAVDVVKENTNKNENIIFPDIEPILIHCAREISLREDLKDGEKIIITPCKSLKEMGNKLLLDNTIFMTWLEFLKYLNNNIEGNFLKSTPIPLGFFDKLNVRKESLSGDENIKNYFKNKKFEGLDIIEMLYCHNGCHNGDGVVENENY